MYISHIKIKNFRCFAETELAMRYPGDGMGLKLPNINLLLGNNGSGKSSILKALALGALSPVLKGSSGLVLYRLKRIGAGPPDLIKYAEINTALNLHEQDQEPQREPIASINIDARIKRLGSIEELESLTSDEAVPAGMFEDNSPAFLLVGYGVTRRVEETINYSLKEQTRNRRLRYARVAGLFENNYGLIPLQSWLPHMEKENKGRYVQVVHLIDRLTPDDMDFEGEFKDDEFYFNFRGVKTPFGALSDGYRHYIGWIADLIYHICMGCPKGKKLVENHGVVLVDEIDLLLHPEWQRSVVHSLSQHLPNLQFVFTTHSPIVASSVEAMNAFVMEPASDGSAKVVQYDENIYGKTSEQVLLSSYFGLSTSRPESFIRELEPESEKALHGDHEAALQMMRKLTKPMEIDKEKFGDILEKV